LARVHFADFDVVTKDTVVRDFERVDSGGGDFFFFDGFERGFGVAHQSMEFIEFRVVTCFN
jgi:hypothetical protein